jgi:leader peptidase (prepilin peptidase) / N-methyltransferase
VSIMTWLRIAVAFPLGLVFGSFLTVVTHRVPQGESLVAPRSRCPVCGTQLRNFDNVPLVSWLLLRGRCRSCKARISLVYPLTELATASLFAAAALTFDRVWVALMMAPFLGLMVVLAVIDIRHRIIPNRLAYPSLLAFAAYILVVGLLGGGLDVIRAAIGMLAYGGALLVVAFISPRGMGMGDVKLAALIGLVLGSLGLRYVTVAAGVGILLGGVGAIVALIAGASRKNAIPFGPFLTAGALVAAFQAPQISSVYLRYIT